MAEFLADTEVSVTLGMQTRTYWVNAYMRLTKAELTAKVDRRTDPAWVTEQKRLMPGFLAN